MTDLTGKGLARTRREVVHYVRGQAPVAAPQAAPHVPDTEVWRAPMQELRARLRDEMKQGRVTGEAWEEDVPGLPRGWSAVRVRLVPQDVVQRRRNRRALQASMVLGGVAAIGVGAYFLVSWFVAQIVMLLAGATAGAGVAIGVVAALLLLAAGGTTVIVTTTVTVRRWF